MPDTRLPLVLASSSRYRRELLERLKIPFETESPDIDETPKAGETNRETALRLARQKAEAVLKNRPGSVVIGSDQVAECGGTRIGKPGSFENAMAQLKMMRGKTVYFHTALCVLDGRAGSPFPVQSENVETEVVFRDLPDGELAAYLKAEEPYDCAGSAKNEAMGILLLEKIESTDPTALTGLPLIALSGMLRKLGADFFGKGK